MMDPELEASYTYYDNDLLKSVEYGNGDRKAWYYYDGARRLTRIEHRSLGVLLLELQYTYYENNLVDTVTESDAVGAFASVARRLLQGRRFQMAPASPEA